MIQVSCPTCHGSKKTIIRNAISESGGGSRSCSEICRNCKGEGHVEIVHESLSESAAAPGLVSDRLTD
jgi:DnaJ-class molecular chaperone